MNGKKNLLVAKIGFIFITIGILGLFFPFLYGYILGDIVFLQEIANVQNMETISSQFVDADYFASPDISPILTPDYNLSDVKNRLRIPKTKVDMPIFLSDDSDVLWKGGWLFPSNSRPNLGGNSVIFGHRFRYIPPISNTFYHLDKIDFGDEIIFSWEGKEYKYKVVEKRIIEPTDLSVIKPTEDNRLTLITCAPLFSTKQRLVVVGFPVE